MNQIELLERKARLWHIAVDSALMAQISDVRAIIGLHNQLVHNYPQIETGYVSQILQTDLPKLLSEVRTLLSASPSPGANPA